MRTASCSTRATTRIPATLPTSPSPRHVETTYHLEFRYAEDLSDLQSWFEGNYAYWNAAAIAVDYDQETMKNVIELFVTENLTERSKEEAQRTRFPAGALKTTINDYRKKGGENH